jgi:N-acetylglucosamine kinase-like BadF-type ATPase
VNRSPLIELPAALRLGTSTDERREPRLLLGVDGGATKTLAAVLDLRDGQLRVGRAGPSNPDAIGVPAAIAALGQASEEALARAGVGADRLDGAVLTVAGTDLGPLTERLCDDRPGWIVVNDVVGAWAVATGAQPGIGVIAGTGSNVLGIGADNRAWRAGGWGHVLGDEGSGYWLAVQALKAVLSDRDGSGPATALGEPALAFFGVRAAEEIPVKIFSEHIGKDEIAAFAPDVAHVAATGDAVARALYEDGARLLGRQISAVISHANLHGAFPVGLVGGVFKTAQHYLASLTREIHVVAPQARVAVVDMAPVGGSLLLACRAAGGGATLDRLTLEPLVEEAVA